MSYKKSCNRCGQQILMDESLGKWRALNVDGTAHICQEQAPTPTPTQPQVAQPQPKQEQQSTDMAKTVWGVLEQFNKRIQKLESIVLKEGNK